MTYENRKKWAKCKWKNHHTESSSWGDGIAVEEEIGILGKSNNQMGDMETGNSRLT